MRHEEHRPVAPPIHRATSPRSRASMALSRRLFAGCPMTSTRRGIANAPGAHVMSTFDQSLALNL